MSELQNTAKAAASGPFGGAAPQEAEAVELGGPENRRTTLGPLPVNTDLMDMASRLAAEQARVASGANNCCIAVCSPDPGMGRYVEYSVGEIAARFARCLRSYDSIHLFGRDRVVLCMPHIKPVDAASVLGRLKAIVCTRPFQLPDGRLDLITASLGGAMMEPRLPVHEAINRADRAMEAGRLNGPNQILLWSPGMF